MKPPASATKAATSAARSTNPSEFSTTPKNPPKKGSFAEILARGQQNQAKPIGAITHKPIESVGGKKTIMKQQKYVSKSGKQPGGKAVKLEAAKEAARAGRPTEKSGGKVAYQGTSRPKLQSSRRPGYKGTMKPSARSSSAAQPEPKKLDRPEEKPRKASVRKEEYSDEEEDSEGGEGQYDQASEDYSDMDAGWDDVEEEEQVAVREAKKEDAYEQMMLEEMKRQKEQRKKRMAHAAEREKAMR